MLSLQLIQLPSKYCLFVCLQYDAAAARQAAGVVEVQMVRELKSKFAILIKLSFMRRETLFLINCISKKMHFLSRCAALHTLPCLFDFLFVFFYSQETTSIIFVVIQPICDNDVTVFSL